MSMNESESEELSVEQRRALDLVRALRAPIADPDFRARLASDFVAGRLSETPRRVVTRLSWALRPVVRWGLVPLAAAAALVAMVALNQGPVWRVTSSHGEGIAIVNGMPVPMGHLSDFDRLIQPGVQVRIPDGSDLEIQSAGNLAIQLAPGSDVTLPNPPGRWFWRESRAELRAGELRITTGARFHGARLAIATPETRIEVTGTTLAVICEPEGTCVCVLEGRVRVGRAPGDIIEVPGGRRRYVFADGRPPIDTAMLSREHEMLPDFRDSRRAMLEGKDAVTR